MSEYIYSENDVRKMWQRSYSEQIGVAQAKCLEAIVRTDGKLEVSFSGGKDSAVLLYLMAEMWSSSSHKDEPLWVMSVSYTHLTFMQHLSSRVRSQSMMFLTRSGMKSNRCLLMKDTRNWQKVVTDVVSVHHKNFIQKGCGIYGSDLCNPYH